MTGLPWPNPNGHGFGRGEVLRGSRGADGDFDRVRDIPVKRIDAVRWVELVEAMRAWVEHVCVGPQPIGVHARGRVIDKEHVKQQCLSLVSRRIVRIVHQRVLAPNVVVQLRQDFAAEVEKKS